MHHGDTQKCLAECAGFGSYVFDMLRLDRSDAGHWQCGRDELKQWCWSRGGKGSAEAICVTRADLPAVDDPSLRSVIREFPLTCPGFTALHSFPNSFTELWASINNNKGILIGESHSSWVLPSGRGIKCTSWSLVRQGSEQPNAHIRPCCVHSRINRVPFLHPYADRLQHPPRDPEKEQQSRKNTFIWTPTCNVVNWYFNAYHTGWSLKGNILQIDGHATFFWLTFIYS